MHFTSRRAFITTIVIVVAIFSFGLGSACSTGAQQSAGPAESDGPATAGPIPQGPPGVDYRASCEFQQTGVCVDVFTDGGIDAKTALPAGCTPLSASCIRQKVKGLCKLEQRRDAGRVYSEHLFYSSMAGRAVTEHCINNSGRLVRYDY
ncbi:MAG: hypothetical protein RIF32_10620 [Leptospirales bacterium]|jgi:hypothetical protein